MLKSVIKSSIVFATQTVGIPLLFFNAEDRVQVFYHWATMTTLAVNKIKHYVGGVSTCTHTCVHIHVEAGIQIRYLLLSLSTLFFCTGFLTELGAPQFSHSLWPIKHQDPPACAFPPLEFWSHTRQSHTRHDSLLPTSPRARRQALHHWAVSALLHVVLKSPQIASDTECNVNAMETERVWAGVCRR